MTLNYRGRPLSPQGVPMWMLMNLMRRKFIKKKGKTRKSFHHSPSFFAFNCYVRQILRRLLKIRLPLLLLWCWGIRRHSKHHFWIIELWWRFVYLKFWWGHFFLFFLFSFHSFFLLSSSSSIAVRGWLQLDAKIYSNDTNKLLKYLLSFFWHITFGSLPIYNLQHTKRCSKVRCGVENEKNEKKLSYLMLYSTKTHIDSCFAFTTHCKANTKQHV